MAIVFPLKRFNGGEMDRRDKTVAFQKMVHPLRFWDTSLCALGICLRFALRHQDLVIAHRGARENCSLFCFVLCLAGKRVVLAWQVLVG